MNPARQMVRQFRRYRDEPMARFALRGHLLRPYWRRRFHSFGDGSIMCRPDWIYGPTHIAIGSGVVIMNGTWLAAERSAWEGSEPVLKIGNRVTLSRWCRISATESVVIEDAVGIAALSTVTDSDHTLDGPTDKPLFNPVVTAPVRIGYGSWIGERVSVLRGATIGRFCIIGANSIVRGDIPDNSIAVGAPARVVGKTKGPPWWRAGEASPDSVWLGPNEDRGVREPDGAR